MNLGYSDIDVSVVGVGALHFGIFLDGKSTTHLVHKAIDCGLNYIDTAPLYGSGNSESFVGAAIQDRRSEVVLSTKVGLSPTVTPTGEFGVEVKPLTSKNIRRSLEKSLTNLRTDYIDVYNLHAFDPYTPLAETLGVLEDLINEGKVRAIGCSNYNQDELGAAFEAQDRAGFQRFAGAQVHYNLLERQAENSFVPKCIEAQCGIVSNRSLARGVLAGQYTAGKLPPEGSRGASSSRIMQWLDEDILRLVSNLDSFAQAQGHTVAELAVAWLMSRPGVSVVLAGMRNEWHLESIMRAISWVLSEDEQRQVDEIVQEAGLTSRVKSLPPTFFEQ